MNKFNRASIISILLAALTACGGSGSSGNSGATTATETPIADNGNGSPSGSGTPPRTETEAPVADNGNAPGGEAPATIVLPRIYISTEGGAEVANTENYLNATLRVVSGNGTEVMQSPTEIRGRGNTTWGMPKKPYRLKLGQAASLLGMPAERDWALLANYADKSLVRNKLAMNLGEQVGLPYNPRSRFFELYFNDTYQGVYQLFEHVKTGPDRVNVEKLDRKTDTAADIITGGYFMEIDHRLDEDVCWYTSMQIPICAKDPEYAKADIENPAHPSYAQFNYIKNYVNAAEQAIGTNGNSYEQYFDADAMVNWYLVMELLKNNDAQINSQIPGVEKFTSSVFLYKQRGGKLNFGPLWDFDIGAGNINYNGSDDPTGWHIREGEWHSRLFANSNFGQRVFTKWCELRRNGVISGLGSQVDTIVAGIDPNAINRNFERWKILGTNVGPNSFVGNTHQEEVDYLKTWLNTRAGWMHAEYVREFGECPA